MGNHLTLWYAGFWTLAAIGATVIITYEYRQMRRDKEAQERRPKPVYDDGGVAIRSLYRRERAIRQSVLNNNCPECGGAGYLDEEIVAGKYVATRCPICGGSGRKK